MLFKFFLVKMATQIIHELFPVFHILQLFKFNFCVWIGNKDGVEIVHKLGPSEIFGGRIANHMQMLLN